VKLIRWLTAAEVPSHRRRHRCLRDTRPFDSLVYYKRYCALYNVRTLYVLRAFKKKIKKVSVPDKPIVRTSGPSAHNISCARKKKRFIFIYARHRSFPFSLPRIPVCTAVSNCGPLCSREQYNITIRANKRYYINTTIIENRNTMAIV